MSEEVHCFSVPSPQWRGFEGCAEQVVCSVPSCDKAAFLPVGISCSQPVSQVLQMDTNNISGLLLAPSGHGASPEERKTYSACPWPLLAKSTPSVSPHTPLFWPMLLLCKLF